MPQVDFTLDQVVEKVDQRVRASEVRVLKHVDSTIEKRIEKSQKEIIHGTVQLVNTVLDAVEEVRKDVRAVDWKVTHGVNRDEFLLLKGRVDVLEKPQE
jgi:hypothetical protein